MEGETRARRTLQAGGSCSKETDGSRRSSLNNEARYYRKARTYIAHVIYFIFFLSGIRSGAIITLHLYKTLVFKPQVICFIISMINGHGLWVADNVCRLNSNVKRSIRYRSLITRTGSGLKLSALPTR